MNVPDQIEQDICRKLITIAVAKGYKISVHEGGAWAIKRSTDVEAILMEMASTDADTLVIRDAQGEIVGKILMVYGNGEDVISDHSNNSAMIELCEAVSKPA